MDSYYTVVLYLLIHIHTLCLDTQDTTSLTKKKAFSRVTKMWRVCVYIRCLMQGFFSIHYYISFLDFVPEAVWLYFHVAWFGVSQDRDIEIKLNGNMNFYTARAMSLLNNQKRADSVIEAEASSSQSYITGEETCGQRLIGCFLIYDEGSHFYTSPCLRYR